MSGQQIGTVVGYFVGAYFGNPNLGAMAGGYLGGVISPTVIKGPSIGDAQQQTSLGGQPIPKFFGHCPPVAPTLIDGDKIARKVTRRTGGKGSTTVAENDGFIATRFFLVGEGDGTAQIARITRNGKLVYSTIAGDDLDADSSSFAAQMTIWNGGPTQGPSPALEAIHGVGNVNYYRKRLCFEVRDDDETQTGGAPNQYRIEVIGAGTSSTECAVVPWVHSNTGRDQPIYGAAVHRELAFVVGQNDNLRRSTDGGLSWNAVDYLTSTGWGVGPLDAVFRVEDPSSSAGVWYITQFNKVGVSYSAGFSFTHYLNTVHDMVTRNGPGGGVHMVNGVPWAGAQDTTNTVVFQPLELGDTDIDLGADYGRATSLGDIGGAMFIGTDDGKICLPDGTVKYTAAGIGIEISQFAYGLTIGLASQTSDGYARTDDGGTTWTHYASPDGETVSGVVFARGMFFMSTLHGIFSSPDGLAPWTQVDSYFSSSTANGVMASDGYSVMATDYHPLVAVLPTAYVLPDVPGWYIDNLGNVVGGCSTRIAADSVQWKDVALEIAYRSHPLLPAQMDVDHMTDAVPGLVLGNPALTGTEYMQTMCRWYTVDGSEFDDQWHAVRRGGPIVGTFDEDDLLAIEEEDDDVRGQAIKGMQRVTVMYPDPANKYVPTPQTAPRTSPDVTANNTVTIECPIPFDADTMIQKADILQKIQFLALEGSFKRNFPSSYSGYVTSDPIIFNNRRHIVTKTSNDDLMVRFECMYDRPSAYTSTAIGSVAPPPEPQTSNLKGPTLFTAFNAPSLRSADNVPGMYFAGCGLLPGHAGYDLYISVDGGVSEVLVRSGINAARMGVLADNVGIDGNDSNGLMTVRMDNGELSSVTSAQVDSGMNRFVVISGGMGDVGQFETATETSSGNFDLSNVERGQLGSTAAAHYAGERFVMAEDAQFIAIDQQYAGQVVIFHPVTRGTPPSSPGNPTYPVLFDPPAFIIDGGEIT